MSASIPNEYLDLLTGPVTVMLVTVMPDGQPQATPVWCDFDGANLLINTESSRQKAKNLRANPKVTVAALDPQNPYRFLEMRGTVIGETFEAAEDHIDKLARIYTDFDAYFGDFVAESTRMIEKRVMFTIRVDKVSAHTQTLRKKVAR